MSYCRFAWDGSDVYVYEDVSGGWTCCGCRIGENRFNSPTIEGMLLHLVEHKKAGDFVPRYAIESLWYDLPGPNDPVRPEPEEFRKSREMIERIRKEVADEKANPLDRKDGANE